MAEFSRQMIRQYEQGTGKLRAAIEGLSEAELRAAPIPGKWSTQTVVCHLMDAESAFVDRIKRIVAMDEPALLMWDENRFAERLHYEKQSAADAVLCFEALRRNTVRLLDSLSAADYQRAGQHNQRGRQTLGDVLGYAIWHLDHHLKFVAEKRAKMGK